MGDSGLPALAWTAWRPLEGRWNDRDLAGPGLYRIRRVGQDALDYVGQTGRPLRTRLRDLQPAFGTVIPYRDPHTAGPGIWALRHLGHTLEVSVAAVPGDEPWRRAREAIVISEHRAAFGHSPTLNFGRMPAGYAMSTARTKAGRGGLCRDAQDAHGVGRPPQGALDPWGHAGWCGHAWSLWTPLRGRGGRWPAGTGLYVIRAGDGPRALYIGQGVLRSRVTAHARKAASTRQGQLFRAAGTQVSWAALPGVPRHHLQELENDLISAYVLSTGHVPAAQFLGGRVAEVTPQR